MNPASCLPLAAGGEFTQPSLRLLFHVCRYIIYKKYFDFRSKIQLYHPVQSSLSLFDGGIGGGHLPPKYLNSGNFFKRSPSTNSNLSLAANFKMPSGGGLSNVIFKRSSVTSLRSPAAETPPDVPSEQEVRIRR